MKHWSGWSLLTLFVSLPVVGFGAVPDSMQSAPSEEAIRRYTLGRLLEESGEVEEALGEYYRALSLDPRAAGIAARVSELAGRAGDASRSLEFAERGLAIEPRNAKLAWLKGAALFNLQRAPEALDALIQAVDADASHAEYTRTLARVAEHLGRTDQVARAWRRTVVLEPQDGEAWFQLAGAEARLGDFIAADRALLNATDLAPVRPGLLFMQGWIREGQERRPEAIDLYRRHLAIHRSDQVTRRRLVQMLAVEKRWEEAYREAQQVRRHQPDDWVALEVEADLAFRAQRTAEGKGLVQKLRAAAGADEDRVLRIVALLARNKRKDEAIALADAWAKTAPRPRGDQVAAQARALAGDAPAAIARARQAAAAAPDSLEPRLLLARLHQNAGQYAAAESIWTTLLGRGDSVAVLLEIGHCREQRGDVPGAEQAVRDAVRIAPDSPRALNFLGYLLADQNRSLDEALVLIRKALALDPDNGAYVDSLGWAYYRLGRLAEARIELERAVRLTGGDAVVREHLGDVYKSLKLLDMAREQYRLSLAQDASNTKVKAKLSGIR